MTPQLKRQLARCPAPVHCACRTWPRNKDLDKTPQFAETLKFVKMQVLTNELQRKHSGGSSGCSRGRD